MSGESSYLTRTQLRGTAAPPVQEQDDAGEPVPAADEPYRAFSRRSARPEFSIHFISPAGVMRSMQYAHLDSGSSYTAECITLTFLAMQPVRVTIHGRNLRRDYENIHQHRTAWVRQAPDDFADDGDTIVLNVDIVPLREDGPAESEPDGEAPP